jgi:hypothetical protein
LSFGTHINGRGLQRGVPEDALNHVDGHVPGNRPGTLRLRSDDQRLISTSAPEALPAALRALSSASGATAFTSILFRMNRSFFEHRFYPKSVSKKIGAAALGTALARTHYHGLNPHLPLVLSRKGYPYSLSLKRLSEEGGRTDYWSADSLQAYVTDLYRAALPGGTCSPAASAWDALLASLKPTLVSS